MRVLLLFRGAPGAGKSTYIIEHGLKNYALSSDEIRMMYQSPILMPDGKESIALNNDDEVWKTLMDILEARMKRGEFVVVDATNSKTKELNQYKNLADTYRYRIYCIDMTDLPIEECKRRNKRRPEFKQVPDAAIEKMYSRFDTQKVPSGIKVIKQNELDKIWFKKIDLSKYKKIHHIGDLHGCYTVLKEYLKDGFKDDEFYIFCGDYIDRGIENVNVLNFIAENIDRENVFFIEGNHERWLWGWAHGITGLLKEFETVTKVELDKNEFDPKVARCIYRKLGQCAYYTYHGKTVLVTHAGISCIPENITKVATEQMIRGVGRYRDYVTVAESFENLTDENTYQIFGHRNTEGSPIKMSDRTFNLEGQVEFGGYLRVVTLDEEGFHTHEIKNNVFKQDKTIIKDFTDKEFNVLQVVDSMRKNKYISEKKFGNISSFNFSREAFYDKKWDDQTTKARGLFIDTVNGKIAARSYEKFFAVDERPETRLETLRMKFSFPVTAYVKENGFLGIVSYDTEKDDFFICSKSTPEGPMAELLKKSFNARVKNRDKLKEYVEQEDCTLVFECVDPLEDPHIIKYDHSDLYLLDIVKNDIKFSHKPYEEVVSVANTYGFTSKTKAQTFSDWSEFRSWYDEVTKEDYLFRGKHIEGFVLEDSNNYMVKLKLPYYSFWKRMRSMADEIFRTGNFRRTEALTTPMSNYFYGFCMKLKDEPDHPVNIITLRDIFMKKYQNVI